MSIELITLGIDVAILVLLIIWASIDIFDLRIPKKKETKQ